LSVSLVDRPRKVTENLALTNSATPLSLDWANVDLPDAWPDRLNLFRPTHLFRFLQHVTGFRRSRVELPDDLPGRGIIPKYALLEFHNLPNGNYSKKITQGYAVGFDLSMLGEMKKARRAIAEQMRACHSVLDVGCGGGRLAAALKRAGVEDVWALDPSPYLLQLGARENPGIRFVQGIAENTGFEAERFDGIAVSFLFHELPPPSFEASLREFNRTLKPDGLLAICEPSVLQFENTAWRVLNDWGPKGLYFFTLARFVFEPFVGAWHRQDVPGQLRRYGFELVEDIQSVPMRRVLARKVRALDA
jgi:ubiquinone/menaquinone biosynthesis C-methylase UbiE